MAVTRSMYAWCFSLGGTDLVLLLSTRSLYLCTKGSIHSLWSGPKSDLLSLDAFLWCLGGLTHFTPHSSTAALLSQRYTKPSPQSHRSGLTVSLSPATACLCLTLAAHYIKLSLLCYCARSYSSQARDAQALVSRPMVGYPPSYKSLVHTLTATLCDISGNRRQSQN